MHYVPTPLYTKKLVPLAIFLILNALPMASLTADENNQHIMEDDISVLTLVFTFTKWWVCEILILK